MTAIDNGDDNKPIEIELDPGERDFARVESEKMFLPDEIAKRMKAVKNLYTGYQIESQTRIDVLKLGIAPGETPEDIPRNSFFAYGIVKFPMPMCEKDSTVKWRFLRIAFTYYELADSGESKIVINLNIPDQSSHFLEPFSLRQAYRKQLFDKLRHYYYPLISPEAFYPNATDIETGVLMPMLKRRVGEMLNVFYKEIADAIKNKKEGEGETSISDIGVCVKREDLDDELVKILRRGGFRRIPSEQMYVSPQSQNLWLQICDFPNGLHSREGQFFEKHGGKIAEHLKDMVVLINGIGDFENEERLIGDQAAEKTDGTVYVQSIDVGSLFHAEGLKAIAGIREKTGKTIAYRGHIATFEAKAPYDYIRQRLLTGEEGRPKGITSVVLGNTFGNAFSFETSPFEIFGGNLAPGDKLIVTFEIKPENETMKQAMLDYYNSPLFKAFVLAPLTKQRLPDSTFDFETSDVKVQWDEKKSRVKHTITINKERRFHYPAHSRDEIIFNPGDTIRLYESTKYSPKTFENDAASNGFDVVDKIIEDGIACFVLQKR